MVDLDLIEERAAVALARGEAVMLDPADVLALVAVVLAAERIAERFADEEALAGSPLKALRDALAPFGGTDG